MDLWRKILLLFSQSVTNDRISNEFQLVTIFFPSSVSTRRENMRRNNTWFDIFFLPLFFLSTRVSKKLFFWLEQVDGPFPLFFYFLLVSSSLICFSFSSILWEFFSFCTEYIFLPLWERSFSVIEDVSSTSSYLIRFVARIFIRYTHPSSYQALKSTGASNSSKKIRVEANRCIALIFCLQFGCGCQTTLGWFL